MLSTSGRKPEFLYVHINKCAGTSLEIALNPITVDLESKYAIPIFNQIRHFNLDDYYTYFNTVPNHPWDIETLLKITTIRNPFDRMVSHYEMYRRGKRRAIIGSYNLKHF